jgi:hypothetical protein
MTFTKTIIYFIGFLMGVSIGHIQEKKWAQVREDALIQQIEQQDCSDINPWQKEGI